MLSKNILGCSFLTSTESLVSLSGLGSAAALLVFVKILICKPQAPEIPFQPIWGSA